MQSAKKGKNFLFIDSELLKSSKSRWECFYFLHWPIYSFRQENSSYASKIYNSIINTISPSVLCGNTQPSPEEEYFVSPVDVVTALNHSGWKITNSQQDVHELLCNLVTILEEEAHKSCVDVILILYDFILYIFNRHWYHYFLNFCCSWW